MSLVRRSIQLIAMREIKARWALCPGALVFGILAMMVTRTLDVDDGGPAGMLLITRVVAFLAAGMIGLSLLGDQLTDGRLSFYFTRPFTPATIFTGKLIGGLVLAFALHVCLVLPVVLGFPAPSEPGALEVAHHASAMAPSFAVTTPEIAMGIAACVILGMAAGIVVRSRTRWLVLDVLGVATLLVMISYAALHIGFTARFAPESSPIWRAELISYYTHVSTLLSIWLASVLAALAFATARALARGRIDREIAHAALSKTLWPIVVPAGGAAIAVVLMWL